MNKITKTISALLIAGASIAAVACSGGKQKVTIYTSTEDYNMAYLQECLDKKFPDYEIVIEYMSTSNIGAKIVEEGASSDCDIVYMEEYGYMEKMIAAGALDSIKGDYDLSRYLEDTLPDTTKDYVLAGCRTGGGVIVNNAVLQERGLAKPTSYADLLNPAYHGLVSMAPLLQKMNMDINKETDPIRKNQIMNNSVKKFIDTNLEKLLEQRSDQNPDFNLGGGMINLMDIMNGTINTSWIR